MTEPGLSGGQDASRVEVGTTHVISEDDVTDNEAADQAVIDQARKSYAHGKAFTHLWDGDIRDCLSLQQAIEEFCYVLAIETRNDPVQMERLFHGSGLARDHETRWNQRSCENYIPNPNAGPPIYDVNYLHYWIQQAIARNRRMEMPHYEVHGWDDPVPLNDLINVPPFPTECLPRWLRQWVEECSISLQAPPDLFGMLALPIAGAGLARIFEAFVRSGWQEPLNLYTATALPVGERKSVAVRRATEPIHCLEIAINEKLHIDLQNNQHHRAVLEKRLKAIETAASKSKTQEAREQLQRDMRSIVDELSQMPHLRECRLICDDETPEHLAKLLAEQNGRMLQASAEGTLFEVVLGRYSERANFDVYLKGHIGDFLSVGRIGREGEKIEQPALSVAVAVQPDVIAGLAADASLNARGFLARFLYAVPESKLGRRDVNPPPMGRGTQETYNSMMRMLWCAGSCGTKFDPRLVRFSAAADGAIREFQGWIEPRLEQGAELANLAGWATKLAGTCVRIAAILYCCEQIDGDSPRPLNPGEVSEAAVEKAVKLCRDYLLPHARAALGLMGSDPLKASAQHVVEVLAGWEKGLISRRDIHRSCGRLFQRVADLDPVIELLEQYGYLKSTAGQLQLPGRGHKSPEFLINPRIVPR